MQRIGLLVVILAVGFGVWQLVTSDDAPESSQTDPATTDGNPTPNGETDPEMGTATGVGDGALPQIGKVVKATRILLIGKHQNSWAELMVNTFEQINDLEFRTWYTADLKTQTGAAGDGRGMADLTAQPTADYLKDHDVEALFLDAVDPNSLPESFWVAVTERVQSGRMGLFFRPTYFVGQGGEGVTQHPALTHPALSALLPIKRAALLQGSPLPGVYAEPGPLRVTEEGIEHPATKLVDNKTASSRAWARTANGDGAFATKFCYPVIDLKPGAKMLVALQAATPVPAIVASPDGKARVLWMGNVDFGQRTYFVRSKDAIQKLLVNHWVLWLVGA